MQVVTHSAAMEAKMVHVSSDGVFHMHLHSYNATTRDNIVEEH
jgi:dTDP-4-dehydrorhamnose reductase